MKAKSPTKRSKVSAIPFLQKWQRNGIFEAIRAAGLDPREFELKDTGGESRIQHRWSASYLVVGYKSGLYTGQYVVGDGPSWPYDASDWQAVLRHANRWLEDIKRDLETPDLWAELQREVELLGGGSAELIENAPFTSDEQQEIARRLEEVATDVKRTHSLSRAQARALDEKLDYLVRASARLGRIDWRNAFVGAILGYLLSAALPPESLRDIFATLVSVIGDLIPLLPGR